MSIDYKEVQVSVADLELGMHVVRLDCPWEQTDFLLQGFIINTPEDIEALQRQCQYVFIEARVEVTVKGKAHKKPQKSGFFSSIKNKMGVVSKSADRPKKEAPPKPQRKVTYINNSSFGVQKQR